MNEHEKGLIQSFIIEAKRERYTELLSNEGGRKKFRETLGHFRDLVPSRCILLEGSEGQAGAIQKRVNSLGAPDLCYVISESSAIDRKTMPLSAALEAVCGSGFGTFLSFIPGKLAYFEDEDGAYLLRS